MEDKIFNIIDLKRDVDTDIVLEVIWQYGILKNGKEYMLDLNTSVCEDINEIDTNSETFINFGNLTKDIVIDWLKETLTIHQFREMDAVIETKIERSGIYGSPWSVIMPTYEELMVERTGSISTSGTNGTSGI
jgi:hypothetical protein